MPFSKKLSRTDKVIVILHTFPKVVRGIIRRPFFHSASGVQYIGKNVRITHANRINCGKNVKFEDNSEIHGLAETGLVFGNKVTIGRGVMIRPSSYYGGDLGSGLIMGENSSIGPHGYVGCSGKITIGSNVMIGPKCSLFAENHVFKDSDETIKSQGVVQKGITIEDDCWIGSNTIILDGVTIGKGSVIGAGTLITKNVPQNSLIIDKRDMRVIPR